MDTNRENLAATLDNIDETPNQINDRVQTEDKNNEPNMMTVVEDVANQTSNEICNKSNLDNPTICESTTISQDHEQTVHEEDVDHLKQEQSPRHQNMKTEDNDANNGTLAESSQDDKKALECKTSSSDGVNENHAKDSPSNLMDDGQKPLDMLTSHNIEISARPIDKGTQDSLISKVNKLAISEIPAPMSEVVLKNPSEALKHLLVYENSTDEEDEYEDLEKNWQFCTTQSLLGEEKVPSDSDSESDSVEFLEGGDSDNSDDETSIETIDIHNEENKKKTTQADMPTRNEYVEEPHESAVDVSKLTIDYDKEEFLHIGHVKALIDTIVTVEAIPDSPAYDLDSVLFVENKTVKRPLGAIFDVIGPVTAPIYCIRFKCREDVDSLELKVGDKVFSAPNTEYTRYVFVKELLRFRGTDASWVGDGELPEELVDISDGEKESILEDIRQSTRKRKHGSLERHQRFEKSMNKYNTMNSKVYQLVDIQERMDRGLQNTYTAPATSIPSIHNFDPSVPPPVFRVCQPPMLNVPSGSTWRDNVAAPGSMHMFPQMIAIPPTSHVALEQLKRFHNPAVMPMAPAHGHSPQFPHRGRGRPKGRGKVFPPEWHY